MPNPTLVQVATHAAGHVAAASGRTVAALPVGGLNPLRWLGAGVSAASSDAWKTAMIALWSAGLWLLQLAFRLIDAFTTPGLSTTGPIGAVLPYTFGVGAGLTSILALVQVGVAAWQRDGRGLSRVLVGLGQFGAVWVGYLGIAAALVTATAGLTTGLLSALLHVSSFSAVSETSSWPRQANDTVTATVLGLCTVCLIVPAAFGYLLIMLVREAALLLLAATSPISAAGLVSEATRSWFWKSLRWFLACLMIAPLSALVLGVGVQISRGTVQGAGDKTTQAVGMAVTGSAIMLIGAICPLVLFRLLAFVDPGTSSGVAMRQSLAAHGGLAGLLTRPAGGAAAAGSASPGSGAAGLIAGGGTSAGEASAASVTASRFAAVLGPVGLAAQVATQVGQVAARAAAVSADVLGGAGVGHQAPYFGGDHQPLPPTQAAASALTHTPPIGTGTAEQAARPTSSQPPEPAGRSGTAGGGGRS